MNSKTDEEGEQRSRQAALVEANLFVEDPEAIAGLVFPVAAGTQLKALIRSYDTQKTTNHKVRCSVCPQHQKHFRGFVAELSDSSKALVGINCGQRHFGQDDWARMSAQLLRQQDQAHYAARAPKAVSAIATVYPILQRWQRDLSRLAGVNIATGSFRAELIKAAQSDEGRLTREVERSISVADRDGRTGERHTSETVSYGRIPSAEAYASRFGEFALNRAIEALQTANRLLAGEATPKAMADAFLALRRGRRELEDAERYHQGCLANCDLTWWQQAADWYVANGGRAVLKGRVLFNRDVWKDEGLALPERASLPASLFAEAASAWPD